MNYKTLFLLAASFLVLFAVSCDKDDDDDPIVLTGISLDKSTLELEIDSSSTLVATLEPDGVEGTIAWSSSDPTVATVNNGVVTAIKAGATNVIAESGDFSAFCLVTVLPEEIIITGISLDQSTLELKVDSSATLIATLEPVGAEGTITWASSDPMIATVNNGVVTALAEGEVTVAASCETFTASCEVTVLPEQNDLHPSLMGSDYYVIQLDETSYGHIASKVVEDFRVDNVNSFLYIWPDGTSFTAETSTGLNFYGQEEDWISLSVANLGWSGAGYFIESGYGDIDMTNMYNNPDDYVFHVALKSAQPSSGYSFIFNDGSAEAKVVIGNVAIEGVQPYMDFTRDNEWQEIEIPFSYINSLGVYYNQTFTDVNILAFLAGGVQGTTVDMDAMFFYKKAE